MNNMANIWMIRAGPGGFLYDDFKENNVVAIGWNMGDLSNKSLEDIKELAKNKYPTYNKRALSKVYGQVNTFCNLIQIDDYVLSYNYHTRKYLVGKITSNYYYYSDKITKTDSII